MNFPNIIIRFTAILLFFPFALSTMNAAELDLPVKTSKKGTGNTSALNTKTVKLIQTEQKVNVTTPEGQTVALPQFDKVMEESPSLYLLADNIKAIDFATSSARITESLIVKRELQELSSRLGINIIDEEYIDLYREVANWLGTKYKLGSMSAKGVDCSGFTNVIYKSVFNMPLPRVSTDIARNVKESITSKEHLLPGDMVFFSTFGKKYINHVGVYIGEGKFIHASIKKGVIVSNLKEGYYSKNWKKGGRM